MGFLAGVVVQKGWAPATRVITGAGALNLDDVSAKVGQRLGAPRASQHAREVEDTYALQRVHPCILPVRD